MNPIEYLGLAATATIFISLTQSNTLRLRMINTVGSVLFVIYGLYIGALSVWLLNAACAVVNIVKAIAEHLRNTHDADNMPSLSIYGECEVKDNKIDTNTITFLGCSVVSLEKSKKS